jgi:hypothetical protein
LFALPMGTIATGTKVPASSFPIALNFAPIRLEPGQRYVWRLEIDGKSEPDWRVAFNTRPAETGAGPTF